MTKQNEQESRAESHKERIDRELVELLQELRVAIPGVQILFAFLLTLPFTGAFDDLGGSQRAAFSAALLCAAAATALLIAPTAYHRWNFRAGEKERMLFTSNRFALAGLALVAVAIACALFVVFSVVFGAAWAGWSAGLAGLWFAWLWYALPLLRRRANG